MQVKLISFLLPVLILGLFTACNTTTEKNEANIDPADLVGLWRATNGVEFNILILFADNSFAYAEYDSSVNSSPENGLEVGAYSFDATNNILSFNLTYDDNDPGNDSGVGDIGTQTDVEVHLLNNGETLSLAGGELELDLEGMGSSPITGVWRMVNGTEFSILTLFADNTFGYAENDLSTHHQTKMDLKQEYTFMILSQIVFNLIYCMMIMIRVTTPVWVILERPLLLMPFCLMEIIH